MTRLLDLTTLSVGVCLVTFLYLPSVVLAFAVGRLGSLSTGDGGRIPKAAAVRSEPLPAAIAATSDEG